MRRGHAGGAVSLRGLLGVHSRYGLHTRAVTVYRDPPIRRLQPLRYLHDCSDCFRLERMPGGACTHWKAPPFHGARQLPTLTGAGFKARVWHCLLIRSTLGSGFGEVVVQERSGRVGRRLAAIMAADVAGYSRLMHDDEEATHARLTALLADAVEPAIAEHGGRIVKTTGDGFLAEFPSAVEAVRAALLFQRRTLEFTIVDNEDRRLR